MISLVNGELLKIRTTRSFWWTILLGLALVILITILQLHDGLDDEEDVRTVISNAGIIGLLMIILGVVGSAGEYRHGTITSSLLSIPSKTRFLTAKALAHALAGLAVGVVTFAIVFGLTILSLNGNGQSLSSVFVTGGEVFGMFGGVVIYTALAAVLGVGIGALLTNQVAAVVAVLILLFVIDPTLAALFDSYGKWGLSGTGVALSGGTSQSAGYDLLSAAGAGVVFLGYVCVVLIAAIAATSRRDVSS